MMLITVKNIKRELYRLWGEIHHGMNTGNISIKFVAQIGNPTIGFIDIELTDANLTLSLDDLSARTLQPAVEVLKAKSK